MSPLTPSSRTAWSARRLICAALALAMGTASAGTFSVSPVRIYMQARERATAITIVNEGETDVVMQADLFEWRQKPGGEDELVPTEDLILAPPVLKLAPKARQVLRLANLKPVPGAQQLTYRMIVREIPEALPARPGGVQVQVALAFSLPIFITPAGAKSKLDCKLARKSADVFLASCNNQGQAYAQPVSISLASATGAALLSQEITGGYILPQAQRQFEIKRGPAAVSGPVKLSVTLDDGSRETFDAVLTD